MGERDINRIERHDDDTAKAGGNPWPVIVLLVLIGILNYLDRALPAILAEAIKHDLNLSDTTLGSINGILFLFVYAAATMPLARVSDSGRYKQVVVLSLAVWSVMTMLGGWATSAWQLALSRMGVALGEAGGTPAAHAYITRNIPIARRAMALSIFTLSLPIGTMAGFVVAGVGGEYLGWRWTFILAGVAGLALAIVSHFLLRRGGVQGVQAEPSLPAAPIGQLLRKPSVIAILAASSFMGMGGYTSAAFTAPFLMRSHSLSLMEVGVAYGAASGLSSVAGLLLVGWITDKLGLRDRRWMLGTVIVMLMVCVPFSFITFTTSDVRLALFGLGLNHTLAVAYVAPVFAAMHRLAPIALRARASGLQLLASSIMGGVGPVIAGVISDGLEPELGSDALARAMFVIPAAYFLAMLFYAAALWRFRRDVET